MTDRVFTSAGAKVYIGTTASNALTDSYTQVGGVETIPNFGRTYQINTFNPIDTRGGFQTKGSFLDGSPTIPVFWDADQDDGQIAVLAALDNDSDYNFKVEANNAPEPETDSSPTTWYFKAKVASFPVRFDDVNGAMRADMQLAIKPGSIAKVGASTATT